MAWKDGELATEYLYTLQESLQQKKGIYIYIYIYIDTTYLTLSLSLRKSDMTQMSERDLRGLH